MEELVRHNLERIAQSATIGEHHKQINTFIGLVESSYRADAAEVDSIISLLSSTDVVQKIVKTELVNVFERSSGVVDILTSEDMHLINRVLKFQWFFEGKDRSVLNPHYFLEHIFPRISFSTRQKVLHALFIHLKDEALAEGFFEAVRGKYGVNQAIKLLPICGCPFIQLFLQTYDTPLTCRELSYILKKAPYEVYLYLEKIHLKSNTVDHIYKPFLKLLAHTCPSVFIRLFERCNKTSTWTAFSNAPLGRRSTQKLIYADKSTLTTSAEKYIKILKLKDIFKNFTHDEFKVFYLNSFPKSISCFDNLFEPKVYAGKHSGGLSTLVRHLPLDERRALVLDTFLKVYGQRIADHPSVGSRHAIQLLLPQSRNKLAESRYAKKCKKQSGNTTDWICFMTIDISVPRLKKLLLEAENGHSRSNLIAQLVLTCSINEDTAALADICKLVATRYRNDSLVIEQFLLTLMEEFDLMKLSDEHWCSIDELLQISIINDESQKHTYFNSRLIQISVKYHITRNDITPAHIQQLVKLSVARDDPLWDISFKDSRHEKQLLVHAAENLGSVLPSGSLLLNKENTVSAVISVEKSIIAWNTGHPQERMSAENFPWLMDRLQEIVLSDQKKHASQVISLLSKDYSARQTLFPFFLKTVPNVTVVSYFARQCPSHLSDNMQVIIAYILQERLVKPYKSVFRKFIFLKSLGFCDHIVNTCKDLLSGEGGSGEKSRAIALLSYFMVESDFCHVTSTFLPSSRKVDVFSETDVELYTIQKVLASSFKNIKPFYGLQMLLKFCTGDYLKLVLGSLMSICCTASELRVHHFLEELTQGNVSARKHALRLACHVLNVQDATNLLSKSWQENDSPSIREVLLQQSIKFLAIEPSPVRWQGLTSMIKTITGSDKNVLSLLAEIKQVPLQYKNEFIKLSWNILTDIAQGECKVYSHINKLLNNITPDILTLLTDEFIENLVKLHLFDPKLSSSMFNLCAAYIFSNKTKHNVEASVSVVKIAVHDFVSSWRNEQTEFSSLAARSTLYTFIKCLSIESFDHEPENVSIILEQLILGLKSCVPIHQVLRVYLYLEFSIIYHSVSCRSDMSEFGRRAGQLVEGLVPTYGVAAIPIIASTLETFVKDCEPIRYGQTHKIERYYESYNEERCLTCIEGLLDNRTENNGMVAAQMLPSDFIFSVEGRQKYEHNLKMLAELCESAHSSNQIRTFLYDKATLIDWKDVIDSC